jgi:hypothetical protein
MSQDEEWGDDVLLSLASHVLNRRIIISNFDRLTSTDLRRHVMGPESARNHPPIYLLYFTETAVYSAHYQSIMPAVFVAATSTSTNVTNVTNQRNRLESIPENGEIPDPVLQSTTNNASCLVTTETSRNRRELSYMDSSNIIRSKRRRKE